MDDQPLDEALARGDRAKRLMAEECGGLLSASEAAALVGVPRHRLATLRRRNELLGVEVDEGEGQFAVSSMPVH